MTHPDTYGRRQAHRFGIVDMNDAQPVPAFLAERRDRALRAVEGEITKFVEGQNEEDRVDDDQSDYQQPADPLGDLRKFVAALPTLSMISVAKGILEAGAFGDKMPSEIELAVAMAKWGSQ